MRETARISLRVALWAPIPLTFLAGVPWWLARALRGAPGWDGALGQWLGFWLIANGLGLAGWCVHLFITRGRGTPLPLDPPKTFVVAGPYRYVRNPMALGFFLVVAGQALLYRSWAVAGYLALVMGVMQLFICAVEEPGLERRFGAAYLAYRRAVPRWLPRWPGI